MWLPGGELVIEDWQRLQAGDYQGVAEFSGGRVVYRTARGRVVVEGQGLELASMDGEALVIRGRICALRLEEGYEGV